MNIILNFLRTIIERQIDGSIDTGQPLSVWVRWLISCDESLMSYEKKMRAIDTRLRGEASVYLASVHKTDAATNSQRTFDILRKPAYHHAEHLSARSVFLYYTIVPAVAVMLIGIFLTWHHFSSSKLETAGHAPPPFENINQEPSPFSEKLYQSQKQIRESIATEFAPLTHDLVSFPNLTASKKVIMEYGSDTSSFDKLIGMVAESNPLCAYVVTCYVTPTLE